MTTYRIHGDNIVECERIANLIINEVKPEKVDTALSSPATLCYSLTFRYADVTYDWILELLPGFNKAGRRRWPADIFQTLRDQGSFLDETPDAIVTRISGTKETILYAIEFCSALQAGNQAWQRSGRAFSTGRTGCPYLYIVDFVKYELDSKTRACKALRFPNPAVPYSYINFSRISGNFVAQIYTRAEEFDKSRDPSLRNFNENDFADQELSRYLVKKMCALDTTAEEESILRKNLNVVLFLTNGVDPNKSLTGAEWKMLYEGRMDIVDYSVKHPSFNFHKIITAKGHHGKTAAFLGLVDRYSVGLASKDLPFGIIPAQNRHSFACELSRLYPAFRKDILLKIADSRSDLILCLIKGFKPRGDDNRPDRGVLPLAAMLASSDREIMTFLYGPVLYKNYLLLSSDPKQLAAANGFWRSILALSDFVALDTPILSAPVTEAELLIDTTDLKEYYLNKKSRPSVLTGKAFPGGQLTGDAFPGIPSAYHEDDVDTGIHYIFTHLFKNICFEGICNPPGGDWSGLSLLHEGLEKRWLSLPRVSEDINGKRPDHVLELFGVFEKPLLLSIESKERSADLEPGVGKGLISYIQNLLNFIPNVERERTPRTGSWRKSQAAVPQNDFIILSAAAYLKSAAEGYTLPGIPQYMPYGRARHDKLREEMNDIVFENSECELLFIMTPRDKGWAVEMVPRTPVAHKLKLFMITYIMDAGFKDILIY